MSSVPNDLDTSSRNFNERYVAFIDILGFKQLVERAEKDLDAHTDLKEILAHVRDTLCEVPQIDMRLTQFSDCIVISAVRSDLGLLEMFQSINLLTFNLLQLNVFVRGGLTAGLAVHSRDSVYGTPVNRAYELESKETRVPMTLVSAEVLKDAMKYGPAWSRHLHFEAADRWFVHHLERYANYRPEPIYSGMVMMERPAQRIIDFVSDRLNKHNGDVLAKAEWFQGYWNDTVASEGVFSRIEHGMTPAFNSGGPTIMVRRRVGPDPLAST